MDSLAAVTGVDLRQAQTQVQFQTKVLAEQLDTAKGVSYAALRLIQTAVVSDPAVGNNVDLTV